MELPTELAKRVLVALECACLWTEETEAHGRVLRVTDQFRSALSRSPVVGAVGGEPTDKEAHEPYLCIAPACGKDCSGCNSAISPADMRKYAVRYAWLRSDDIEVPQGQREIVVQMLRLPFREDQSDETLFGRELDEAIDAAMGGIGVSPTGSPEGEVK